MTVAQQTERNFIIAAGHVALSSHKTAGLTLHFLQIANTLMTNFGTMYWKLLPRSLLRIWGTAAAIENFKPSVTGEVLGENRRSYRRGCERRFAFAYSVSVPPPSLLPFQATVTIFLPAQMGFFPAHWRRMRQGWKEDISSFDRQAP